MSTNRGNIKKNDIEENILKNDIKEKYLNDDELTLVISFI